MYSKVNDSYKSNNITIQITARHFSVIKNQHNMEQMLLNRIHKEIKLFDPRRTMLSSMYGTNKLWSKLPTV